MTLHGKYCLVRPWHPRDADSLARHANNKAIAQHLRDRFPHPYTRADAIGFIKHAIASPEVAFLAIDVGGEAVGGIGFVPGSDVERFSAEIGYWLGEAYWGRGIMSEALTMVTEQAFRERHLLRIYAVPFADNTASIRVLEKAGYVREGIMRASSVKYGVPRDQAMYARINPDWRFSDR